MVSTYQNCIEEKAAHVCERLLESLGYRLVRVKLLASHGGKSVLQIMIERRDCTPITIEDCSKVDKLLAPALGVEAGFNDKYALEVSSPGIDRPLTNEEDFAKNIGALVKILTSIPLNNRKRFIGRVLEVSEEDLSLKINDSLEEVRILKRNITEANLIFENIKIPKYRKSLNK
jgi:ribosome maturation factor RimP